VEDSGTPILADDIIPILANEDALALYPGNPYGLIQVDKGITIILVEDYL